MSCKLPYTNYLCYRFTLLNENNANISKSPPSLNIVVWEPAMARVGHGTDRRKILKMPLTQFFVPALCHLTVNTAVITSTLFDG